MSGTLLVDASVYVSLAEIGATDVLYGVGDVAVPHAVYDEVTEDPAATRLEREIEGGHLDAIDVYQWVARDEDARDVVSSAANHAGYPSLEDASHEIDVGEGAYRLARGDVALLAAGLHADDVVVITDDAPLRNVCETLSVPVSSTLGVLIATVERGDRGAAEAIDLLHALDEAGPRLGASLVREAEELIEEVADG